MFGHAKLKMYQWHAEQLKLADVFPPLRAGLVGVMLECLGVKNTLMGTQGSHRIEHALSQPNKTAGDNQYQELCAIGNRCDQGRIINGYRF